MTAPKLRTMRDILRPVAGCDRLEIRRLHADGVTLDALAAWFPYSRYAIGQAVAEQGGARNVKLDPAQVAQIIQRHAEGASCVALAKEFGVHRNSVHRAISGKTWKA
jgi:hypothetical protein